MIRLPLRFRPLDEAVVFVNDAGRFFRSDPAFLARYGLGETSSADDAYLLEQGHVFGRTDDLAELAHAYGLAQRLHRPRPLDYLILAPTLRCNLACSYCQVSRAPETQAGFDWSEATLQAVLAFIDARAGARLKVEFQGGEPLLRPDLLERVMDHVSARCSTASFVICSNLSRLDEDAWKLMARPNVLVSTSLDGDAETHRRNRTETDEATAAFSRNLEAVIARFGIQKVSALPTIDYRRPPDPDAVMDAFAVRGLTSIYLRPVNYQGFARKQHAYAREGSATWNAYYEGFVRRMIARNAQSDQPLLEEFYLTHCLHRILQTGHDDHVDLRNPNILGADYLVIDYDGAIYPTDEARMVTRAGIIDLRVGDVFTGLDQAKLDVLNRESANTFDADCIHCAYQPFCGRDVVDDLARYGRIDTPRHTTAFCQRHLAVFDLAFRLLYAQDAETQRSVRHWLGLGGDGPLPLATGP